MAESVPPTSHTCPELLSCLVTDTLIPADGCVIIYLSSPERMAQDVSRLPPQYFVKSIFTGSVH